MAAQVQVAEGTNNVPWAALSPLRFLSNKCPDKHNPTGFIYDKAYISPPFEFEKNDRGYYVLSPTIYIADLSSDDFFPPASLEVFYPALRGKKSFTTIVTGDRAPTQAESDRMAFVIVNRAFGRSGIGTLIRQGQGTVISHWDAITNVSDELEANNYRMIPYEYQFHELQALLTPEYMMIIPD